MSTKQRRLFLVGAAATVAFAGAAGSATAHVTVSSTDAAPGGYGKVVVRVPSESETASTTKVQITMPEDTPFSSVRAKPHPGWEVQIDEAKLPEPVEVGDLTLTEAVRTVTWTAEPGQGIQPDMFDEFELSIGPFPEEPTTLMFPAVQTYSDGEVVRWTQPTPPDGAEPEHPAPVLELTADGAAAGHDAAAEDVAVTVSDDSADSAADDDNDTLARTIAIGGFVVGVLALGASIVRRRREGGD
ncbi:MAG: YcnI family protein [Nocardioidaceae bacterium]